MQLHNFSDLLVPLDPHGELHSSNYFAVDVVSRYCCSPHVYSPSASRLNIKRNFQKPGIAIIVLSIAAKMVPRPLVAVYIRMVEDTCRPP